MCLSTNYHLLHHPEKKRLDRWVFSDEVIQLLFYLLLHFLVFQKIAAQAY